MEIEAGIVGLMMDPETNMPVLLLKEVGGSRILHMCVGIYEANAIALEIERIQTPRPMTHDLLRNACIGLNAKAQKVVVSELKEDTFYAQIWLEKEDGTVIRLDSRPSDAMALALRMSCPIFVEEGVFGEAERAIAALAASASGNVADTDEEQLRRWLKELGPEDLGGDPKKPN